MKRRTRMLAFLLALVMVVSMIPAAAAKGFEKSRQWASNQFSDVPEYQWYYDTVKEAYELGLMSGDPDGSFRPDGSVTLAETVAVASRIHAIHHLGEEKFVQGEVWYEIYVDYALQNGILEKELSDYKRPANRLEFAEILSKALPEKELKKINEVEDGAIPDVKDNEAVYLLYRAGVLTGNDDRGTFAPNSNIKRSEVAAIVARMALPELRKEITLKSSGATIGNVSDFTPVEKVDPEDYIDENNALTKPFDLVYPEIFESGAVDYSGEQILIKMAKDSGLTAALKAAGVTAVEKIMEISSGVWYKAYVNGDVKTVMEAVRQIKDVLVAEYDFAYETEAIIDSTEVDSDVHSNKDYADQWYLCSCGIQKGWGHLKHHHHHGPKPDDTDQGDENVGIAGEGVVVAVIDTGVDYDHEDLKDSMWINTDEIPDNNIDDDKNGYVDDYYGYNAVADKGSADDDNGHGTHVAGIIAAADNNLGIVGIAYNAKIMAVKAGMASGFFNNSDIAEAIIYAHDNGADVINMSFGGSATTIAVTDALEYAYTNCVLVASAGNDGKKNEPASPYDLDYIPNYPAALSYVLGVMSVDQNGVESSFTNWDLKAFNSVEYEVYAPGEAMLSTIPGNQYAKWNGTSMAAPVVSAVAALLRAEFYDRTMYPTKFIYGQISGTSTQKATCLDSEKHGKHNLPKIVDLYQAMTVLPKPEVGVSDYVLFDTPGLQGNTKNNGDGVIDAGETIAIGFTLRNRWGKTGETVVSVDTLSHAGISDPYVTIVNNDVSYGSVGTYSTQNAGWIKDADGVYIGWEKPIYLQIAADCPNDYIVGLNVITKSTNGLDAADTATYEPDPMTFRLDVRRGKILSNVISEDMTLTSDDVWIIPNATIIDPGVTVTVEPGTQIQFWSDDPNDSYATSAITYLVVEGEFICEGTEEEPVRLYPSERMGAYRVEIREQNGGAVRLFHTEVVNPYLDISYAEHCEFRQNYRASTLAYRYLSGGTVQSSSTTGEMHVDEAKDCAIYKLGGGSSYPFRTYGYYDGCIFVDSAMDLQGQYENCVFLGNNNYQDEKNGGVTTIRFSEPRIQSDVMQFFYNEDTGTTYVLVNHYAEHYLSDLMIFQSFAEYLGGYMACINTKEELNYICRHITKGTTVGLHIDPETGMLMWLDGTELGDFLPIVTENSASDHYALLPDGKLYTASMWTGQTLLEIPGKIYVGEILLSEDSVVMDTNSVGYQIQAELVPAAAEDILQYTSSNPAVAVVDENGFIKPVAPGETEILISSSDGLTTTTMSVTVMQYVAMEAVDLGEDLILTKGESHQLMPVLTPENTTEDVYYRSSDETVAVVGEGGLIEALEPGTAIIEAVCKQNETIADSIRIEVVIPLESVTVAEPICVLSLDTEETVDVFGVSFAPSDTTSRTLVWESSNPEVVRVDESGLLVKGQNGNATLRATVEGTDLYAEVVVFLTNRDTEVTVVQMEETGKYLIALLSDGTLWYWGSEVLTPRQLPFENVKQFKLKDNTYNLEFFILNKEGVLQQYNYEVGDSEVSVPSNAFNGGEPMTDVAAFDYADYGTPYGYALKTNGTVYAWGGNKYGQLGDGSTTNRINNPVQIDMTDIQTVVAGSYCVYLLDNDGNLYYCGNGITTFTLVEENVESISRALCSGFYVEVRTSDSIFYMSQQSKYSNYPLKGTFNRVWDSTHLYQENGKIYVKTGSSSDNDYGQLGVGKTGYLSSYEQVLKVESLENLFVTSDNVYFQTTDGKFFSAGRNNQAQLGNLTAAASSSVPGRVFFGIVSDGSAPALSMEGVEHGILTVDADRGIRKSQDFALISLQDSDGTACPIKRTVRLDKLLIEPVDGWVDGETYTLTIPQNAIVDAMGVTAPEQVFSISFEQDEMALSLFSAEEETNTRFYWTEEMLTEKWYEFLQEGPNYRFYHNAIINRLDREDKVETEWLRLLAPTVDERKTSSVTGNYWGTTSEFLINKQIVDFDDYQQYANLNHAGFLTTAPENVWPFAVKAGLLDKDGNEVEVVGNEKLTFYVDFNRDMDTSIALDVRFGSAYPYADYAVEGQWASARRWEGTTTLNTLIEGGYQYWSIDNGRAADAPLKLYKDWGRFQFEIDTTSAQAMVLQGQATDEGVQLTWFQDDFDTLAGYNVYRAKGSEDAQYTRLNPTIIPSTTKTFLDDNVEPGEVYFYNFTVVKTDLSESTPSGRTRVLSKDTIPPSLIHTPVNVGTAGKNLTISATVTDNLSLNRVTLYYRTVGTAVWKSVDMANLNDKYSAIVAGNLLAVAGLEYYIEAFDGVGCAYKGTADAPYTVTIREKTDSDAKGDFDGDGTIDILDAYMILQAASGKLNADQLQFARADLNGDGVLTASEALTVLKYVNGEIGSLQLQS